MRSIAIAAAIILAGTVLFLVFRGGEPGPSPAPPNVILVVLDAARADHFTCYGYDKPTTPNIDRIAARGAVFLNAFAPATQTYDSMPLIMSSRYYSREIFPKDTWRWNLRRESARTILDDFDPEQIFLPDLLARNSYRTAIVHDHWWFHPRTDFVGWFDEDFHIRVSQPTDEALVSTAIDWIGRNRDVPFFLYLHIMSPHAPYPPKEADLEFVGEDGLELAAAVRAKFLARPDESARGWSEEELRMLRALYDGNLHHSDHWIGILYSRLEEWGLASNTLFILTSDHGEHLGQHNHLQHGGPSYDSGIHVPLIMAWPGMIPSGIKAEGLCELIDIPPTVVDLCSLETPPGKSFDGRSLRDYLSDPAAGKEAVYGRDFIRTGRHKLLRGRLFDVIADPGETVDISGEYPEVAADLEARHREFLRPFRERFEAARKTDPPEHPFYLPLHEFAFTPRESVEYVAFGHGPRSALRMFSTDKPWALNRDDNQSGLFFLQEAGDPAPVNLSIRLPEGSYRVLILVEDLRSPVDDVFDVSNLRGRFPDEDSPRSAPAVTPLSEDRLFYLDWGEFRTEENRFEIELTADPGMGPFFVHLVRFDPGDARGEDLLPPAPEEEIQRRIDGLRSLGYL